MNWILEHWRSALGDTGDYDSGTNLIDENAKIIALLTDDCDEDQAKLIADAPNLLAENERLKEENENLKTRLAFWVDHWNRLDKMYQESKEFQSKAKQP